MVKQMPKQGCVERQLMYLHNAIAVPAQSMPLHAKLVGHCHDCCQLCTCFVAEELYMLSEGAGLELQQVAGMVMNPVTGNWGLSVNTAVNYIAYFSKVTLKDRVTGSTHMSTSKAADLASA